MTTRNYGYKSWTVSKKSEMAVDPFEEELLRRKCGSVKERDTCSGRYRNGLYKLYDEPCITVF